MSNTPTMQEIERYEDRARDAAKFEQMVRITPETLLSLCAAARRGVNVPATEDQNARFAIEGCIEYGRQGVNPPPDHHWLAPFWNIGKQLSEIPEKDDRLLHLEEAYQSSMRVGVETKKQAERAEAERDGICDFLERWAAQHDGADFEFDRLTDEIRARADQRGPDAQVSEDADKPEPPLAPSNVQSGPHL